MLALTLDELGDRLPVISGVYADGSFEAARIARLAGTVGSAGLLVFPPQSMTIDGQLRPEMACAFRNGRRGDRPPLICFNYPLSRGLGYPHETLFCLVEKGPSILAVKDWPGDPMAHERNIRGLQSLPRPVNVLTTHSAWLLRLLVLGRNGLLSSRPAPRRGVNRAVAAADQRARSSPCGERPWMCTWRPPASSRIRVAVSSRS